ncbi:YutD family protein [Vagococcus humatus]|uniref:YutD family protein n=1 Tax=Vagococcus humatus TaxID=1889241 RepID=UPI001FB38471|nr:YutD family protein [Vagococcus humatus]
MTDEQIKEPVLSNPEEKEESSVLETPKRVRLVGEDTVWIDEVEYKLVENYREAFQAEQVDARYSDILSRYDFIVGDIGFEQLRLKGFFSADAKKKPADTRIDTLQDYLYEYCNFGCAYFVLERVNKVPSKAKENKPNRKRKSNKKQAFTHEKKAPASSPKKNKKKPIIKNRKQSQDEKKDKQVHKPQEIVEKKKNYTIRKKEN